MPVQPTTWTPNQTRGEASNSNAGVFLVTQASDQLITQSGDSLILNDELFTPEPNTVWNTTTEPQNVTNWVAAEGDTSNSNANVQRILQNGNTRVLQDGTSIRLLNDSVNSNLPNATVWSEDEGL